MNVFLNLQWLIGGMRDDQVRRKNLAELRKFLVHGLTERSDLLLVAHVDRKGDRTAPLPLSPWILPCVVIQVLGGALVSAADFDQVTEVDGSAGRRCGHSHIAYCIYAFELTGRVENYLPLASLECAARSDDVAGAQHISQRRWLQTVRG